MAWGFAIGVVLTTLFWLLLFSVWPEGAERLHQWVQRKLGG